MTDQEVIRIGRPPQAPKPRRKMRDSVIAASVLIASSLMVASVALFDPFTAETASVAPSVVENHVECVTIRREHDTWIGSHTDLAMILQSDAVGAKFHSRKLTDAGDALHKAVRNYSDDASREFAVVIAQYNLDINKVEFELQLAGKYETASYDKAAESWQAVERGYQTFMKETCG